MPSCTMASTAYITAHTKGGIMPHFPVILTASDAISAIKEIITIQHSAYIGATASSSILSYEGGMPKDESVSVGSLFISSLS